MPNPRAVQWIAGSCCCSKTPNKYQANTKAPAIHGKKETQEGVSQLNEKGSIVPALLPSPHGVNGLLNRITLTNITLLVLNVSDDSRCDKAQSRNRGNSRPERWTIFGNGCNSGDHVQNHQDKDPGMIEREGEVQEDHTQKRVVLGRILLLEAKVDMRYCTSGEEQWDQGPERVTLGLTEGLQTTET